jgi:hypothetical protein
MYGYDEKRRFHTARKKRSKNCKRFHNIAAGWNLRLKSGFNQQFYFRGGHDEIPFSIGQKYAIQENHAFI